jgi:TolA-binding protein
MNEAMALLERLKSSFPASKYAPEADLVYGEILMKSRRSAEAKKVFQQFLQKYPKHKLAEEVRQMLTEL